MGTIKRVNGGYAGEFNIDKDVIGEIENKEIFGKPFLSVYGDFKPRNYCESILEKKIADGLYAYVRFETSDKVNKMISKDRGAINAKGTFIAKRECLEVLGIDEDTLFRQAADTMSIRMKTFDEVLESMGIPKCMTGMMPPIYVLSSREEYGAGAIADKRVLENIRKDMGDFVIVPSSVHEVLIMPLKQVDDLKGLTMIIREVNRTVISKTEWLSDDAYIFDGELHKA